MNLKLTTKRALEFEKRTGKDLLEFLKTIAEESSIKIKDAVDLFLAMGDYTVEDFDNWDESFNNKITKMMAAVTEYIQGKN